MHRCVWNGPHGFRGKKPGEVVEIDDRTREWYANRHPGAFTPVEDQAPGAPAEQPVEEGAEPDEG